MGALIGHKFIVHRLQDIFNKAIITGDIVVVVRTLWNPYDYLYECNVINCTEKVLDYLKTNVHRVKKYINLSTLNIFGNSFIHRDDNDKYSNFEKQFLSNYAKQNMIVKNC